MSEELSSTPILSQNTTSTANQDATVQPPALPTWSEPNNPQPPPRFLLLLDELYPNDMEDTLSPEDWSTDWPNFDGPPEINIDLGLSDVAQLADQLFPESLENLLNASNLNFPDYLVELTMMGQPPWTAPPTQPMLPPTQITAHAPTQVYPPFSVTPQHEIDLVYHQDHQNPVAEPSNASLPGSADVLSSTAAPSEWIYPLD
ncbi:hypothetical protein BDV93DRAFT_510841 [Ceratobasidium sp. AG-I]|nr:hypothetical protein BDV93DRAFT_510841 [Ceratobasidium sp. AG-I]